MKTYFAVAKKADDKSLGLWRVVEGEAVKLAVKPSFYKPTDQDRGELGLSPDDWWAKITGVVGNFIFTSNGVTIGGKLHKVTATRKVESNSLVIEIRTIAEKATRSQDATASYGGESWRTGGTQTVEIEIEPTLVVETITINLE